MVDRRSPLTEDEREIYLRNILLPEVGESGQLTLLRSRVLVVGLGGLGSPALFYLAAAGVGELGIVDSGLVDLSNLQRQILHTRENIGVEKTISAREAVTRLRPDVCLKSYSVRLSDSNAHDIIGPYDFVIEATDNFEAKFLVNDVCARLSKPFCHAGIVGMYGQVMTILPGKGPCYRCIFGEAPPAGSVQTTDEVGVLGSVAGVMGAIQATEAIKYLLNRGNLLVGRLLTWDALTMVFREVGLPLDKRCDVCAQEA